MPFNLYGCSPEQVYRIAVFIFGEEYPIGFPVVSEVTVFDPTSVLSMAVPAFGPAPKPSLYFVIHELKGFGGADVPVIPCPFPPLSSFQDIFLHNPAQIWIF